MIHKSARPIIDPDVLNILRKFEGRELFSASELSPVPPQKEAFIAGFEAWIKTSPNELGALPTTWQKTVTDGTTGAFQDFYLCFPHRPLFVLAGEYPFHGMLGAKTVKSFNDIPAGAKLILSHPFSATGDAHPDLAQILQHCESHDILVLIDAALLFISDIPLFNVAAHSCIAAVAFSLSKSFCTGRFRIGLKYTREDWAHSPSAILNTWDYLNHLSMSIHLELLAHFPAAYLVEKYRQRQRRLCQELGVEVSPTVIFGTSHEERFREYSRSGVIHRLCLSEMMGERLG